MTKFVGVMTVVAFFFGSSDAFAQQSAQRVPLRAPPHPIVYMLQTITYQDGHIDITPHVPELRCRSNGIATAVRSSGNIAIADRSTRVERIDPATIAIMVNCEPEK